MNEDVGNFATILLSLAECVCSGLTRVERPVCDCEVTNVAPAWDACDCVCPTGNGRGQLSVYASKIVASNSPPTEAPADPRNDHGCGPDFLVASLEIQIVRPDCEAFGLTVPQLIHADAALVRQAVGCCLQTMRRAKTIKRFGVGATTFDPESGACLGSTLGAWIAIGHCLCPDDPVDAP